MLGEMSVLVGNIEQVKDAFAPGVIVVAGDSKIIWDSTKVDEVEAAEDTFKKLKKKGYAAYSVKKGGEKGEVLHAFDAQVEKIIMAPARVGG